MVRDGRLSPVLVISTANVLDDGVDLEGIEVIGSTQPATDEPDTVAGARLQRVPVVARGAVESIVTMARVAQTARLAGRLLRARTGAVVVVGDDRAAGVEMGWLTAAARLGVPSLVVPYALSDPSADALVRRRSSRHQIDGHPLRRLVARRWPDQAYRCDGTDLLFYPAGLTLGLSLLHALPARPWVMGGGHSTRVAVLGERDRRDLLAWGAPAAKLIVTGQPSLDDLAAVPDGERIVCAVPQLAEHALVPWDQHEMLIDGLFGALAPWADRVDLSLHPKSDPVWYAERATRHGLTISRRPLRSLLGGAAIFIASWSSTVRWAAMLGVPTVIDDRAGLSLDVYGDLAGVTVVRSDKALERAVRALVEDDEARARQAAVLRSAASDLGTLDGKAAQRIVDVAADLVGDGRARDSAR